MCLLLFYSCFRIYMDRKHPQCVLFDVLNRPFCNCQVKEGYEIHDGRKPWVSMGPGETKLTSPSSAACHTWIAAPTKNSLSLSLYSWQQTNSSVVSQAQLQASSFWQDSPGSRAPSRKPSGKQAQWRVGYVMSISCRERCNRNFGACPIVRARLRGRT